MQNFSSDSAPRYCILCIEDEDDLRQDLADELREAGYEVIEAANGEQALLQLNRKRPDLILCDISMPGLSGYDVLKAFQKKTADNVDIPFVFLSALANSSDIIKGKQFGADDYLVKPVDFDLLLVTIHTRLRQVARIKSNVRTALPEKISQSLVSFGLTPTETRVALAISEGKPQAIIAQELEIARTTVAFHMRNIFNKTGTSRQAELVALLLGVAVNASNSNRSAQ